MPIEHWMMFGTFAEQKHFAYPSDSSYAGVLVNGNMAAYAPDGIAAFLMERTRNLDYVIDPLTHAFQHDPGAVLDAEGKPKKALLALATEYGELAAQIIGQRPMLPSDLADTGILDDFVDRVLEFQRTYVSSRMSNNPNAKYLGEENACRGPLALIPPYFYLTETSLAEWLPLMKKAAERAVVNKRNGEKLYMSIVVSQGLILGEGQRKDLADQVRQTGCDGFFLWVDNLDENQAGGPELQGLIHLAACLRGSDQRPVVNRHGGYFSVMAAGVAGNHAFSGVMHGPEFGEFRSVVPVGGGIPIARFYIPQLHSRVKYRAALRYLQRKGWLADASTFHSNVCDCRACQEVIGDDANRFTRYGESVSKTVNRRYGPVAMEFPTPETKLRCLRHYLQRKGREYEFCGASTKQRTLDDLESGVAAFESVSGREGVDHLRLWKSVLTTENG